MVYFVQCSKLMAWCDAAILAFPYVERVVEEFEFNYISWG